MELAVSCQQKPCKTRCLEIRPVARRGSTREDPWRSTGLVDRPWPIPRHFDTPFLIWGQLMYQMLYRNILVRRAIAYVSHRPWPIPRHFDTPFLIWGQLMYQMLYRIMYV